MPRISRVKERRLAEAALAGANAKIEELEDDRLLLQKDYDRLLGVAETACSTVSQLLEDLDAAHGDRTVLLAELQQTREALRQCMGELDNARIELGRLRAELAKASAPRGTSGPGVLRFENKKQWVDVVRLVHPDIHDSNEGRKELAERVIKRLIGARPE